MEAAAHNRRAPEPARLSAVSLAAAAVVAAPLLAACLLTVVGCSPRPADESPGTPEEAEARGAGAAGEPAQWDLEWARGAVFYEIFVRSFADSDGDGVGDLDGLTARLDYLNDGDPDTGGDLGVGGIWLMPVFVSPSYHGYDTVDYRAINPAYGDLESFRRFLTAAHRRGIRVIVDLMINHTSARHPWFQEAASSPRSPRRDWYVWRGDDPGWTQPWGGGPVWHEGGGAFYYGLFWRGMPDLNFRNPEVRAEVLDIADFWLAVGVDGFRLDAARHIIADGPGEAQNDTPGTHAFWRELAAHVRERHPGALLVGENWTTTPIIAGYYGSTERVAEGDELPMSFNFPLAEAILTGVGEGRAGGITATLEEMAALYPPGALDGTFLTNHDMTRLATQLGGDPGRLRSAAAVLLTLPGTPFLYYGEEVGLANGPGAGDEHKRTPMPWDPGPGGGFTTGTPWFDLAPGHETTNVAAQAADPGSLLATYRRLIGARNASPALALGTLEILGGAGADSPVLAFLRREGDEVVLAAHNLSAGAATAGPWPLAATTFEEVFTGGGATAPEAVDGGWRVSLPPHASGVWRLR